MNDLGVIFSSHHSRDARASMLSSQDVILSRQRWRRRSFNKNYGFCAQTFPTTWVGVEWPKIILTVSCEGMLRVHVCAKPYHPRYLLYEYFLACLDNKTHRQNSDIPSLISCWRWPASQKNSRHHVLRVIDRHPVGCSCFLHHFCKIRMPACLR